MLGSPAGLQPGGAGGGPLGFLGGGGGGGATFGGSDEILACTLLKVPDPIIMGRGFKPCPSLGVRISCSNLKMTKIVNIHVSDLISN